MQVGSSSCRNGPDMERGSPSLDCPSSKNREHLVVPFLFGRETLKLVAPDACVLLPVRQHIIFGF